MGVKAVHVRACVFASGSGGRDSPGLRLLTAMGRGMTVGTAKMIYDRPRESEMDEEK